MDYIMTEVKNIKWNFSSYTDAKGRTYIISYYNQWDSEKKQSRVAKRVHVGRLNSDTGEVTCGKSYLDAHPDLIGKNLFYEDNKLVEHTEEEVEQIKAEVNKDLSFRCDSVSFGLTYGCWELAKSSGMQKALTQVFGNELGNELLRLGIYELCSHGEAMQNYEDWLAMNYLPNAEPLSSQKISYLLSQVQQEQIDEYFVLRYNRIIANHNVLKEKAKEQGIELPPMMMAIDSTSISTYSETIDNAAFGHAKQDDFLKQINLTLCVDYATGDTCYAYESEGSINDMSLFPDLLLRMQNCGIKLDEVLITTDRGYSSVLNVQKQLNCDLKFLTGVKLSEDTTKKYIDKYRSSLSNPAFLNGELGVYARTTPIVEKWTSTCNGITTDTNVYLHLYRDGELGERQNRAFMADVQRLLKLKVANKTCDPILWRKYSKSLTLDDKSKKWSINASIVEKACKYNGYFAIRTNTVEDPFDSMVIYRERNIVETCFRQFKVLDDGERLRATASSYKGKLFIHLLAQNLRMMMTVAASKHKADGKVLPGDSITKAMLQLQKLQASKPAGRGVWIVKEIPKKTRDLFDLFKIAYPKKQVKN